MALLNVAHSAHARPDYCEQGETTDLPGTAQPVEGEGTLERLNGMLEGPGVGGEGDFGDMYLIEITEPEEFRMRLVSGGGVRPQLWLFAGPGLSKFAEGVGLLGNNGVDVGFEGAILENASTDGTGIVLTEPGFYYLAVTGQEPTEGPADGRVPQALNTDSTQAPGVQDIFAFGPGFEISGPDGPGGDFPIDRWRGIGDFGFYSVEARGVTLIPNPCPADLSADGIVNVVDVLFVLANWGECEETPSTFNFEEDFNGFLEGLPLIPQQPCFPTCDPGFSWQAFNNDPYGAGSLILADPDPAQGDNTLSIRGLGNDDLVHTFDGLPSSRLIFSTDVFVPAGAAFDTEFSLMNAYTPEVSVNFSLRLVVSGSNGELEDIDSGATLPLIIDGWVTLTVLIDLETDIQTVLYNDEVLVVKSWTEGATGGGDLNVAGTRMRWIFADSGGTDTYYDDFSLRTVIGPPPCAGDLSRNGSVDLPDLLAVLSAWGDCP